MPQWIISMAMHFLSQETIPIGRLLNSLATGVNSFSPHQLRLQINFHLKIYCPFQLIHVMFCKDKQENTVQLFLFLRLILFIALKKAILIWSLPKKTFPLSFFSSPFTRTLSFLDQACPEMKSSEPNIQVHKKMVTN